MKQILILAIIVNTLVCSAQLPKGDRILSWQVDVAQNNNYDSSFFYAQTGCMNSTHLAVRWSKIEPDTGVFDISYINNTLDIANFYYPAHNTKLELQISPIYAALKQTPSELQPIGFYSSLMINRFKILLDTVFAHIPNLELSALNIGNEHNILFGSDPIQYNYYKTFLDSVIPYAKQVYFNIHGTELKIGTTFTFTGLTDPTTSALCKYVNDSLDIVSLTYYPLNPDFTMRSPMDPTTDFSDLVTIYSDTTQPIYFVECGYATSSYCNSNETKQLQFFQNVFTAWDSHYNNIKYLSIFKTNDWSPASASTLATEFNITDTIFIEYLRTLGVRTWDNNGTAKLAYNGILCELNARNWCGVNCSTTSINELIDKKIQIYPNPTTSVININNQLEAVIYNSIGEIVLRSKQNTIDVSTLKSGVYFIQVQLKNGKYYIEKLIKH